MAALRRLSQAQAEGEGWTAGRRPGGAKGGVSGAVGHGTVPSNAIRRASCCVDAASSERQPHPVRVAGLLDLQTAVQVTGPLGDQSAATSSGSPSGEKCLFHPPV